MTEYNIFDYLKEVLFSKKRELLNLNQETHTYQPYMLQRWCSMASTDATLIINETTNRWAHLHTDKNMFYKVLHSALPKHKFKKVAYIKKAAKSSDTDNIKDMSNTLELSHREVRDYLTTLNK